MKQVNGVKDANPKNQLSSIINKTSQSNLSSNSVSQMRLSLQDKSLESEFKKKQGLGPQEDVKYSHKITPNLP